MFRALILSLLLMTITPSANAADTAKAYFAGGCFWCMESSFESLDGVSDSVSGYMMLEGRKKPTEVVEVHYDPAKVSYDKLLEIYWLNIDPDDEGGQFYDRGDAYRTAIFYSSDEEKNKAIASKADKEKELKRTLAPIIAPAGSFDIAEAAHQNFYKTNEDHYKRYKNGSGRPDKLKQVWGDKAAH